jgi:hypothetical protein
VSQEEGLEINNLFPELSDCGRERIILCCEDFDLGLQIRKPLLLPLATLQGSNPVGLVSNGGSPE